MSPAFRSSLSRWFRNLHLGALLVLFTAVFLAEYAGAQGSLLDPPAGSLRQQRPPGSLNPLPPSNGMTRSGRIPPIPEPTLPDLSGGLKPFPRIEPPQLNLPDRRCLPGESGGLASNCIPGAEICPNGLTCAPGSRCSIGGGCVPANATDCGQGRYCPANSLCLEEGGCSAIGATRCTEGRICAPGTRCTDTGRCTPTQRPPIRPGSR